jgi:ribosomal protein L11 methyltransferase
MTVLDVGAGSGILSRAARLLGATRVFACDIDPEAVAVAGEGFIGSADAVRSGVADVVVANISAEAIIQLAPELLRALRPGGVLVASGFESHESDAVKAALPAAHAVRRKGNWAVFIVNSASGR